MSEHKDDGTPAFPRTYSEADYSAQIGGHNGMTLRQWYAGMALQGMLSSNVRLGLEDIKKIYAETAFRLADAMIAEGKNGIVP